MNATTMQYLRLEYTTIGTLYRAAEKDWVLDGLGSFTTRLSTHTKHVSHC